MIQKHLFQIFLMLIFGTNLIFGFKFHNCYGFYFQGETVIDFHKMHDWESCNSELCVWSSNIAYAGFSYNITIQPLYTDIRAEQIEKNLIMSDSKNSRTYSGWFCTSNYNQFACSMNKLESYNVSDHVLFRTDNFEPNTYLDMVQTYVYQKNGTLTTVACVQYKAYIYDDDECQQSSIQTLLNELNQAHKELIMIEMSDLFIGLIEQKLKFIESLKNRTKTILKNKRFPFFCPEHHNYSDELQQLKLKLKLVNITEISNKVVDKKNLEPLVEYVDEILQNQSEKIKLMEADGQFSKIDIIQRNIILLNSQKNSLKSIDLLVGDLKQAQQLITSTFLLIEELQSLLP